MWADTQYTPQVQQTLLQYSWPLTPCWCKPATGKYDLCAMLAFSTAVTPDLNRATTQEHFRLPHLTNVTVLCHSSVPWAFIAMRVLPTMFFLFSLLFCFVLFFVCATALVFSLSSGRSWWRSHTDTLWCKWWQCSQSIILFDWACRAFTTLEVISSKRECQKMDAQC